MDDLTNLSIVKVESLTCTDRDTGETLFVIDDIKPLPGDFDDFSSEYMKDENLTIIKSKYISTR